MLPMNKLIIIFLIFNCNTLHQQFSEKLVFIIGKVLGNGGFRNIPQ